MAQVSAGILQLEKANQVVIKANADVKAGLLLINDAESKIVGSWQVLSDHLAKIAATAKLTLGDAAMQSAADMDATAKILAKFDLAAGGSLNFNAAAQLLAGSGIQGSGDVNVNATLDFSAALDALKMANANVQADANAALIKAKTFILSELADLKLKATAGAQNILANVQDKLQFAGKIDIQIDGSADGTVCKFLHGAAGGNAAVSVNGMLAVDVTGQAAAQSTPAMMKKRSGEKVWTVNYGATETTVQQKDKSEIATTTTTTVAATDPSNKQKSSTTQISLAIAALVAALAFMN